MRRSSSKSELCVDGMEGLTVWQSLMVATYMFIDDCFVRIQDELIVANSRAMCDEAETPRILSYRRLCGDFVGSQATR